MLYGAEVAVYSEINTKHTHTHTHIYIYIYIYIYTHIYIYICIQCGQKVQLLNDKRVGASHNQQALRG